jgi:hypothetical protein
VLATFLVQDDFAQKPDVTVAILNESIKFAAVKDQAKQIVEQNPSSSNFRLQLLEIHVTTEICRLG